jgi:hypothetical protein
MLVGAQAGSSEYAGASFDGTAVGLALAAVGTFLVAHAILWRSPRTLIEQRFLVAKRSKLGTIRELVFQRAQMGLGFLFLIAGFASQIIGYHRPIAPDAPRASATFWIGSIVFAVVALELLAWWWSLLSFRRYLRAFFRENPPDFEDDLTLAREVGELFAVETSGEDTVESFVVRLRRAIGVAQRPTVLRSGEPRMASGPEDSDESWGERPK